MASEEHSVAPPKMPRVGLFVTCLVDLFRPSIGFAAVKLLEDAGCSVVVPSAQTCCGQPAYNSGDRKDARGVARTVLRAFRGLDYVVAPSGSCAGMIREHYPSSSRGAGRGRGRGVASRTWELISFLADVMKVERVECHWPARATYHDPARACSELGIRQQPRQLLGSVEGLNSLRWPRRKFAAALVGPSASSIRKSRFHC